MPTPKLSKEDLQEAVDLVASHGTLVGAANAKGIPRGTMEGRHRRALQEGFEPQTTEQVHNEAARLRSRVSALEQQVKEHQREDITTQWVKETIYGIHDADPTPPGWINESGKLAQHAPGVPTLFLSDWHFGEYVDPDQVQGVNEFDVSIAHKRAKRVIDTSVDLLKHHMVRPDYPGIVVILGGDMMSGEIHDELRESNEATSIQALLDVQGALIQSIEYLADQFGAVFLPCVVGNHGRATQKMRAKDRTATSYDWLLYRELEFAFRHDDRVTFQIADSADTFYRVYSHRYRLTHGDQFRGGDGLIGPLGPIARGDHKKRSRDHQVGQGYDTLLMGHFHSLMTLQRFIVNGSLVGYNEYAFVNNFPYEPPRQALWVTHPEYGITFTLPVYADEPQMPRESAWVSVPSAA